MSEHTNNGFQLKTVHHRNEWTCWSCDETFEGQRTPHHYWRIKDVRGQYWQTWLAGCPDCFKAWINTVLLTTTEIQKYTSEYESTEGLVEYLNHTHEVDNLLQ
jgi:hypothetical protein